MSSEQVSVVIVNWNHGRFLGDCLASLLAQTYPRFDVTLVDNGSTDGSLGIARSYSRVRVEAFDANRGFSRALNWGVKHTGGEFVLSLNPDVTLRPGFLREMVRAMEKDGRAGMAAPKLLRAGDPALLDSTGLFIDRRRRPYDRGQGEADRAQYDALPYVFGACGAAGLYRRAMLEDVAWNGECFDEDFFAYCEDADLAWRAQLRGWRCVYAHRAVGTHVRGWGDTLRRPGHAPKRAQGPRLALRNRYLMTLKNDRLRTFLADLPWIVGAELPRLAYAAITVPRALLGLFDLVRLWPTTMEKRRWIRGRALQDALVRRWFLAPDSMAMGECGC
jgi:GT2 family glycosyltransferase